eukprot:5261245-Heterocapsa_arctica.AAC.1
MEKEMGATAEGASRVDKAVRRRSDSDADARGKRFKPDEEIPEGDAAAAAPAAEGKVPDGGPEAAAAVKGD